MLSLIIHQNLIKSEELGPENESHRFQEQSENLLLPEAQLKPKLYLPFRPAPR